MSSVGYHRAADAAAHDDAKFSKQPPLSHRHQSTDSGGGGAHGAPPEPAAQLSTAEVTQYFASLTPEGLAFALATSQGSSMVLAALRQHPSIALPRVLEAVAPVDTLKRVALDQNASPVLKSAYELEPRALADFVESTKQDDDFWFHLCVDSVHTRRLLCVIIENAPQATSLDFLFDLALSRQTELACDRHGCLTLQRIMSEMDDGRRHMAEAVCHRELGILSIDPFGHYLVTYLTEHGHVGTNIAAIAAHVESPEHLRVIAMAKFGSSCLEKTIRAFPREVGGATARGMNAMADAALIELCNSNFANYVVQVAASVVPLDVLGALPERLAMLSPSLTYATKIARCLTQNAAAAAHYGGVARPQRAPTTLCRSVAKAKSRASLNPVGPADKDGARQPQPAPVPTRLPAQTIFLPPPPPPQPITIPGPMVTQPQPPQHIPGGTGTQHQQHMFMMPHHFAAAPPAPATTVIMTPQGPMQVFLHPHPHSVMMPMHQPQQQQHMMFAAPPGGSWMAQPQQPMMQPLNPGPFQPMPPPSYTHM